MARLPNRLPNYGGGVSGPTAATSTDNAIVRWDGTTGDAVQDSGITISDTNVLTTPAVVQINDNANLQFEGVANDTDGLTISCNASGDATINSTAGLLTLTTSDNIVSTDSLLQWSEGQAITGASYQVGRDADATNQLHFNVPTGATMEWSTNDVSRMTLSSTFLDLVSVGMIMRADSLILGNLGIYFGGSVAATSLIVLGADTQTNDTTGMIGVPTGTRSLLLLENGDSGFDFAHTVQTNPTLFVHSAVQSTTQWISMNHNQTNGVISSGTGGILINRRLLLNKGADVASANDITFASDANFVDITGTTQINTIATTTWNAGSIIVLQFDGSVTVAHNTAGTGASILLAGAVNFAATADDTLMLIYDGTTWREISRTVI